MKHKTWLKSMVLAWAFDVAPFTYVDQTARKTKLSKSVKSDKRAAVKAARKQRQRT